MRAPRVSIQLTPLPRVILEFENGGGRRRRSLDAGRPPRWQPGHPGRSDGGGLDPESAAALGVPSDPPPPPSLRNALQQQAVWGAEARGGGAGGAFGPEAGGACAGGVVDGRELCGVIAAPCEATASLGTDDLPADCGAAIAAAVSETHLLQFGAMLGEASSRDALARAEAAGPVGSAAGSLYGAPDTDGFYGPWEPVVHESAPGLLYWGWRRPLRRGLYMYMTRSVFLGVTPGEMRVFMNDDACRLAWDRSMAALGSGLRSSRGVCAPQRETDVLYAAVKFPKPLAQRSYVYARRVWARPSDGGCYVLARGCGAPAGAASPLRGVAVTDYSSGAVIRAPAAALLGGHSGPAAEVLMIYFEDSHVRAGFANLGIKKGLWPMVKNTDVALRSYLRNGGRVGGDGGASVPPTPRSGGGASCGAGGAKGGGAGWGFGGAGACLRAVAQSLRALAAAAGALWEAHARVASLLPRMELRMLRWLVGNVGLSSGASTLVHRGAGNPAARLPPLPPSRPGGLARPAVGAARPQVIPTTPSRLVRVSSHPLVDAPALLAPQQPPASPVRAAPGTPRLQVRIATPPPSPQPHHHHQQHQHPGSPLARVGSFPLTFEDWEALDDSPPAAESSASCGTPAGRVRRPSGGGLARELRRACSCGEPLLPERGLLADEWLGARYASAAALDARGNGGGRAAAPAPRVSYAASCPAGSCAGSEASGPVSSVGGRSCGPCRARGGGAGGRQRQKGRLVVRVIQAAGVRVAHRLLTPADQQQQRHRALSDAGSSALDL